MEPFEIACKGKDVTLRVNGAITNRSPDCQVLRRYAGVKAEGCRTRLCNVKLKPIDGAGPVK